MAPKAPDPTQGLPRVRIRDASGKLHTLDLRTALGEVGTHPDQWTIEADQPQQLVDELTARKDGAVAARATREAIILAPPRPAA